MKDSRSEHVARTLLAALAVVPLTVCGCGPSREEYADAIRSVIQQDQLLSRDISESLTMWEWLVGANPDRVDRYVEHLRRLDFSQCPHDFEAAYREHIVAWEDMAISYRSGKQPDGLKAEIERTWLEVHKIARKYGVTNALK